MNNDSNRPKLLLQQTIRDSLDNNKYKKLKHYSYCWKCRTIFSKDKYKKDWTICKKCFNDNVRHHIKKMFDSQTNNIKSMNLYIRDTDPICVSAKNNTKVTSIKSKKFIKKQETKYFY